MMKNMSKAQDVETNRRVINACSILLGPHLDVTDRGNTREY